MLPKCKNEDLASVNRLRIFQRSVQNLEAGSHWKQLPICLPHFACSLTSVLMRQLYLTEHEKNKI